LVFVETRGANENGSDGALESRATVLTCKKGLEGLDDLGKEF